VRMLSSGKEHSKLLISSDLAQECGWENVCSTLYGGKLMGEKLLLGLLDDVEGEVGLGGARMRLLVIQLKELSGVLLGRGVVDVLEHSSSSTMEALVCVFLR